MEDFRRYALIYKSEQTVIKEPIGFDGFKPKLSRGESHGTIWEYSDLSIGFCGVGYDICKTAYLNEGIEAEVIFLVEELSNDVWAEFYKGRLDFAQYVEKKGNAIIIELGIAQIDNQTIIRNRLETKVELESLIAFDGAQLNEYPNLKREIQIEGKSVLTSSREETRKYYTEGGSTRPDLTYFNITFQENVKSELFDINRTIHDGNFEEISPMFIVPSGDVSYKDIRVKAEFQVFTSFVNNIAQPLENAVYYKVDEEDPVLIGMPSIGTGTNVSLDISLNLKAGSIFYLYGTVQTNTSGEWRYGVSPQQFTEVAFFEVSGTSKYKATPAKVTMVHEALSRVVESITNGEATVQSDYYGRVDSDINPSLTDGCGSLRGIITGLNLRNGLLTDGSLPTTYTSLKDILNNLSAIDCIGFGLKGDKFIVEPYKYFYNQDVIMSCKNVSNVKREIDLSKSYQLFNNGYKKWEAEEYNGIDGFHGKRQYRTSLKMANTKIEKECSFVADGYAIEATRRRQLETDSKDWRYDNDNFIVCLKRDEGNDLVVDTGVSDPNGTVIESESVYNASISPARNAMRWYSWVMQGVKLDDKLIFAGGEGYLKADLKTLSDCSVEANVLSESQTIKKSAFEDQDVPIPIFRPETVSFEYPITREDFVRIKANPHGLIEFDGEYGWIDEIDFDLLRCMGEFKLRPKA